MSRVSVSNDRVGSICLGRCGSANDRFLRTAVATRAVLMTCHFKPTLPLARADRRRRKSTAAKILKAPLSAQLGIDETSSDALNETDTDLNPENSSAPGETGAQSQVCESSVARPMGSGAAIPAPAADAASGEGSPAVGSRDEGQAKAVIAQPAEPSVEAEKNSAQSAISKRLRIMMAGCTGHKRPKSHSMSRNSWRRVLRRLGSLVIADA
jgi:hypothetical protein